MGINLGGIGAALGLGGLGLDTVLKVGGQLMGQEFAENEANKARDWSRDMSNTAHQREVADLRAAGLNPMISALRTGASTPGAAMAGTPSNPLSQGIHNATTAANVELIQATADRERAEAERLRGYGRENVEEDTRLKKATIGEVKQRTDNLYAELERIVATTTREVSSARHLEQSIANMKETIPQIREYVKLLKAQTAQTWEQKGLTKAHAAEVDQRVQQQLPQIQKALMQLEQLHRTLQVPGAELSARAQQTFAAEVGAILRSLNPLHQYLPTYGR